MLAPDRKKAWVRNQAFSDVVFLRGCARNYCYRRIKHQYQYRENDHPGRREAPIRAAQEPGMPGGGNGRATAGCELTGGISHFTHPPILRPSWQSLPGSPLIYHSCSAQPAFPQLVRIHPMRPPRLAGPLPPASLPPGHIAPPPALGSVRHTSGLLWQEPVWAGRGIGSCQALRQAPIPPVEGQPLPAWRLPSRLWEKLIPNGTLSFEAHSPFP